MDNSIIEQNTRSSGRPCKFESFVLPRLKEIEEWLVKGYTDYSIADSLGIHKATLCEYKGKYNELAELYTRVRVQRNKLVMNAQYEKAKGIEKAVKKPFKIKEVTYENGKKVSEKEKIEYADDYIYVPPDTNAADLYLRNNDPEYKSARAIEIGASTTINFNVAELQSKREELLTELQKLQAIDVKQIE